MTKRPPFWATLLTLCGIGVLCTLGTWQLQRLEWKTDLITKLDAAYKSPERSAPIDFGALNEDDFTYGRASGLLLTDKAFLLGPAVYNKEIGKNLIVPLQTDQGTLLVNLGWTPYALSELPIHHLKNRRVWFEGLARQPHWNSFTPDNEPNNDLWFKPDITEIAQIKELKNPIPFMLTAYSASHKYDAAFPKNARWEPKNDHLQYAFFWFTMAIALAAIYILKFIRRN